MKEKDIQNWQTIIEGEGVTIPDDVRKAMQRQTAAINKRTFQASFLYVATLTFTSMVYIASVLDSKPGVTRYIWLFWGLAGLSAILLLWLDFQIKRDTKAVRALMTPHLMAHALGWDYVKTYTIDYPLEWGEDGPLDITPDMRFEIVVIKIALDAINRRPNYRQLSGPVRIQYERDTGRFIFDMPGEPKKLFLDITDYGCTIPTTDTP